MYRRKWFDNITYFLVRAQMLLHLPLIHYLLCKTDVGLNLVDIDFDSHASYCFVARRHRDLHTS